MFYSEASFSSPTPPPPRRPLLSTAAAAFLPSIFAEMQSTFDCDQTREIGKSNPAVIIIIK